MTLTRKDKFILALIGIAFGGIVAVYVELTIGIMMIGIASYVAGYFTGDRK